MSQRKQLDGERPEAGVSVGLRAHSADVGADEGAPSAYRERTGALSDSKQALLASNHCKGHLLISMLQIVSVAGMSQSLTGGRWGVTKAPGVTALASDVVAATHVCSRTPLAARTCTAPR